MYIMIAFVCLYTLILGVLFFRGLGDSVTKKLLSKSVPKFVATSVGFTIWAAGVIATEYMLYLMLRMPL